MREKLGRGWEKILGRGITSNYRIGIMWDEREIWEERWEKIMERGITRIMWDEREIWKEGWEKIMEKVITVTIE